jgi:hypothetical protein
MSVNLMDMVKQAATKQILGKIGGILGTNEAKTSSAFETAAGSILGGLMKKGSSAQGAQDIFGAVQKQDDSVLDKLGDLLGGGQQTEQFQKQGSGILDMVMGNSSAGMIGSVAKMLGLDKGIVGKLMTMAAPIVMGVIGRHVKNKALDAVGLGNLLGSQKSHLAGVLPASLTSDLGFGNMLSGAGDAVSGAASKVGNAASGAAGSVGRGAANAGRAATGAAGDAANAGGGLIKMLLPLLLLAGLAFVGWKYVLPMLGGAADKATSAVSDGVNAVGDGVSSAAGAVGDGVSNAAGAVGDMANFEMPSFEVPGMDALGETGSTLSTGFTDITKGLAGVTDEAGATDLAGTIGGFTDKVGSLGLGDLTGPAQTASQSLIGKFVETVQGLMGGQSEGIRGILQPAIDALMKALGQ